MLLKTLYRLCTKDQRCVGIDIGTSSIKAMVLSKSDTSIQLDSVMVVELPKGTLKNKEISKLESFEKALKLLRADIPRTVKNAVIAITGSQVITKVIQVDQNLTETEIEYYLYGNLKLVTSNVVGDVNIDFVVLGENKIDENLKDVFVVIAKQSLINSRVLALKTSGFNCAAVDLESYALMRSLQLQSHLTQRQNLTEISDLIGVKANLHIGETTTLLMITLNGNLTFNRELNIGLIDLTINGSKALNLDVAEKLADQLKHCLQNYSSILGGQVIDTWFSSGGGSHFSKLIRYLAHVLSVNINICQPFNQLNCRGISVNHKKQSLMPIQGRFQVALGLAARGLI